MKRAGYVILWFLVLLSLILHVITLGGLWAAQRFALRTVDDAIDTLGSLQHEVFETTIHFNQSMPVSVSIPFRQEMNFPVDVTIPFSRSISLNQTFQIAIDTPFGPFPFQVPISATFPISLSMPFQAEVPVAISQTIPIDTDIALDLTVPVAIQLSETPFQGYVEKVMTMLADIRRQLSLGK